MALVVGTSTAELGLDFVQHVVRDVKVLQDTMASFQEGLAQMRLGIEVERKAREGLAGTLHEQLSRELGAEAQLRLALAHRTDDLETHTKTWVGSIGKHCLTAKDQMASLESAMGERAAQQESTNAKISLLETLLSMKANAVDFEKLSSRVSTIQIDADRDRLAADVAVRNTATRAAQDTAAVQNQLDALQRFTEATKRSLVGEICALTTKAESMEAILSTRARAADVHVLEQRVREAEKALESIAEELSRKAAAANLKALSDRTTELHMDFQTSKSRWEVTAESQGTRLGVLESNVGKIERQFESDRERSSACWVALERELGTKATRGDVDSLASRLTAAEIVGFELGAALSIKATVDEVLALAARTSASETELANKAGTTCLEQLGQTVADQGTKHDALKGSVDQQKGLLDKLTEQVQERANTLCETVSKYADLHAQVNKKANLEESCTRDGLEASLLGFYRREEVDAMLARVWWRVGDISKSARGVPLTAR